MRYAQSEIKGYVLVEPQAKWTMDDGFTAKHYGDLLPLIDFYVFDNPSGTLSSRRVPLESYGWQNPWKKPTYLNHKMKDASNNRYLYYSAASLDRMEDALTKSGLLDKVPLTQEKTCFFDNMSNQSLSCIYHIRNALCHGRFVLELDRDGDIWLICEDVSMKCVKGHRGKKVSARMALKLSTLKQWKQLITAGPTS